MQTLVYFVFLGKCDNTFNDTEGFLQQFIQFVELYQIVMNVVFLYITSSMKLQIFDRYN